MLVAALFLAAGTAEAEGEANTSSTRPAIQGQTRRAVAARAMQGRSRSPRKALAKVPRGFPVCEETIVFGELPRKVGEALRYEIDVNGVSMGKIDFVIHREGSLVGSKVTEYRTAFELDALVSSVFNGTGRAAAMIPRGTTTPVAAMNDYRVKTNTYKETLSFTDSGTKIGSERLRNQRKRNINRSFSIPTTDFVSAFYGLRSLKPNSKGCVVVYSNQRAYTIWVEPRGTEYVRTPVGKRLSQRFDLKYAQENSRQVYEGSIWIGTEGDHLPYQAELQGDVKLRVRVHSYVPGTTS